MFKYLLIPILTILPFLTEVQNVCLQVEMGEDTNPTIECTRSDNYTADVEKIRKPSEHLVLVFAESEIPVLKNHGFDRIADILTYLMVFHSGLHTIEDEAFAGLAKLKRLHLGSNELTEVKSIWFKDMDNLESLILNKNRIANFDPDVIRNLPHLNELDISKNKIKHFDIELVNHMNVSRVDLDLNPYEWSSFIPILKWKYENGRDKEPFKKLYKLVTGCYEKITEGPKLDECVNNKLNEALMDPDKYELFTNF